MRQTAEKAVPLAKSTVKPQRKWAVAQKHRETLGGKSRSDPARSRVYYHRQVRTPYRFAMFGELLSSGVRQGPRSRSGTKPGVTRYCGALSQRRIVTMAHCHNGEL